MRTAATLVSLRHFSYISQNEQNVLVVVEYAIVNESFQYYIIGSVKG